MHLNTDIKVVLQFSHNIFSYMLLKCDPDLVTDPVQGIFTLTQVLNQFLSLQETRSLLFRLLYQEVP